MIIQIISVAEPEPAGSEVFVGGTGVDLKFELELELEPEPTFFGSAPAPFFGKCKTKDLKLIFY